MGLHPLGGEAFFLDVRMLGRRVATLASGPEPFERQGTPGRLLILERAEGWAPGFSGS